jgi:DNA-damage-inducible protein J
MAAETAIVKAQIDAKLKREAESTLKALGLDMTAGIRMFLSQVVLRGGIPFEISIPKTDLGQETLAAIADSYAGKTKKAASVDELFGGAGKAG